MSEEFQRGMANQLERFQGLSEVRWPTINTGVLPSGDNRLGLSRYITEILADLEQSDTKLKSKRSLHQVDPPSNWKPEPSSSKLGMSREEYIRKQNKLFQEMSGQKSWSDMSSNENTQDLTNSPLMTSLELYMAALDEKIYMSADHSRAMIGIRDKEVRDQFDKFKNEKPTMADLVEVRDMYQNLWFQHQTLGQQRDALEVEMSNLRYEHALQMAKGLRLQHATHSLGRKLVDSQKWRTENEQLKDEIDQLKRDKTAMEQQIESLKITCASQKQTISENLAPTSEDSKHRLLETRIAHLFEAVTSLKISSDVPEPPPDDAIRLLETASQLVEIAKLDTDKRISSIIEAFAHQYRARENELMAQIAALDQEKQILIARCDKLGTENQAINSDLSYLEQRVLSLVLMLKSVRASMEQ